MTFLVLLMFIQIVVLKLICNFLRETRTHNVYGATGVLFSARNFWMGRDVEQPAMFRSFLSASSTLFEGTRRILVSPCDL